MKKLVLISILIYLGFNAMAQAKVEVNASSRNMSVGNAETLTVNIHKCTPKEVKKAWAKLMKSYKAKVKNKDEVFADNASIPSMSSNTVDVYAISEKKNDNESELSVAVDLGGAYLNEKEHPEKYNTFKNILKNFAIETSHKGFKKSIKVEEKALLVLIKSQKKLESDNKKLHKSIEDFKKKIEEAEKKIAKNLKNQELMKKDIAKQEAVKKNLMEVDKGIR